VIELTTREGDGDAARTGYWVVTGPQDEHEAHAIIERSLITSDDDVRRLAFAWYLNRRTMNAYNQSSPHQVAGGVAETFDLAMSAVRSAWALHVEGVDDDATGEIFLPWRDS